ncbi:MAG: NADH-quinone oxidoreductase subunit G, partial [Verrucomicrobiales bacterium]
MTTTEPQADEVTVAVTVNGIEIAANKGELLIEAAERHGVYIPRFCYHPRMKPVGMCRVCLVEVDTGRGPGLQPSCMLSVSDGMTVQTESDVAKKAQDGVLEFLLINHPLDCPVCDKGGECPLQDQTMAYGPGESRFVEEKRHFQKPLPISDIVYLDRERCILCDRCTRFASDVAGDPLIHFQARGNETEVNTFPDEPFSSYFSGNTVQICPVGALTAKPYRFKARPWDLSEAPSTATTDSVGSRITVQSSRNEVLRYLGVDSDAVNWGWLSDKERFSFEAWNSEARVTGPLLRGDDLGNPSEDGDQLVAASWPLALRKAAEALDGVDPDRIAVFGGARMSNESQYAWAKLAKSVLGTDNVDAQMGDGLDAEVVLGLPRATIADVSRPGGTVLVLGVDPKETHGALFLRLRHAATQDKATIIEIGPRTTGLSEYAKHSLLAGPGKLGVVVGALLGASSTGIDIDADALVDATNAVAAGPITVIYGRGSLADDRSVIEKALATIAAAKADTTFLPALHRGNIMGALDMGLAPGVLPGRIGLGTTPTGWDSAPSRRGMDTEAMLRRAAAGGIDVAILLGCDPLTDFPDAKLAEQAFNKVENLIAVDCLLNFTSTGADIVFPAASSATEVEGTFTNIEGRISPVARKVTPPGTARPDWMVAAELAAQLGSDLGFIDLDELWAELAEASPLHAGLSLADIRDAGSESLLLSGSSIGTPNASLISVDGESGGSGLSLIVTRKMYDQGTILTFCPSLSGLAGGATAAIHPETLSSAGLSAGDDVTLSNDVGSITLPVVADTGVAP